MVLAYNAGAKTLHYAAIGRDLCRMPAYTGPQCNPETGRCISREALVLASMEHGLTRQQKCRLGQPVTVQDWAGKAWDAIWTPAEDNLDTLEAAIETADYPDPPSLKAGLGGPETDTPPE